MSNTQGHRAWHKAYQAISSALASRSPDQILAVAREYQTDYIVTDADQSLADAPRVYVNRSYALHRSSE